MSKKKLIKDVIVIADLSGLSIKDKTERIGVLADAMIENPEIISTITPTGAELKIQLGLVNVKILKHKSMGEALLAFTGEIQGDLKKISDVVVKGWVPQVEVGCAGNIELINRLCFKVKNKFSIHGNLFVLLRLFINNKFNLKEKTEQIFIIQLEEVDLIEGCLRNDRAIQKKLYDKYCDAMYTIVYRILNNYDEANDVLQEAFIQVFCKIDQFRKESSLGAWIKTIVIRASLKHLREKRTFETLENNTHNLFDFIPGTIDTEILENIILSLPYGVRTILYLVEVEGYKHKEVAEMLNITEGTSKSQLFKAKRFLKEKLKNELI